MASFSNSGTGAWANCQRVFEFDDYSGRDYGEANPPRALLIAKVDLAPGTQAPPPSSRPPADEHGAARLTHTPRAPARGRCGGTTPWTKCRVRRACLKTSTCRSRRRRPQEKTAPSAAAPAPLRLSEPLARLRAASESVPGTRRVSPAPPRPAPPRPAPP